MARSKESLKKRNIRLVERYYYYSEVKRIRFDDSLQKVAEEFFLSISRIEDILHLPECDKYLKKLRKNKNK
jgi:SET domain-containing protein